MTETNDPGQPGPSTLAPFTPPYIPSSGDPIYSSEPLPMPRSTLDGIHGTRDDDPVRWSPSHPDELPPYWIGSRYTQDENDPHLWWPAPPPGPNEIRPPLRGSTQPAALHNGDDHGGEGSGRLDVNPADLNTVADQYAQLQAAAASIGPQAVDEVNRIIASHGQMGYPVAVGVVAGLARRQSQLEGKAADFGVYATRFNEHAAAYRSGDLDGASLYQQVSVPDDWFDNDDVFPEAVDPGGAAAGPGRRTRHPTKPDLRRRP